MNFSRNNEKKIKKIFVDKIGRVDEFTRLESKLKKTKYIDPHLLAHSNRVADYVLGMCKSLRADQNQIDLALSAAVLHDIGFVDLYLSKDDMNEIEFAKKISQVSEDHCTLGSSAVSRLAREIPKIDEVILNHHEKYDGSGPRKLKYNEVPFESGIISLAEYFDNLMFNKKEEQIRSLEEATAIIDKAEGSLFDPAVVAAFSDLRSISIEATMANAARTGNLMFKLKISDYLDLAKYYIKNNPNCSDKELSDFIKKKRRTTDKNSKLISSYSLHKYRGDKMSFPSYPTLEKDNVLSIRNNKNKVIFEIEDNPGEMESGDFVIYERNLWKVLSSSKYSVSLGK